MKKGVVMIVALLAGLFAWGGCAKAAQAVYADSELTLPTRYAENAYVQSAAIAQETLYLLGYDGLYSWRSGDQAPTRCAELAQIVGEEGNYDVLLVGSAEGLYVWRLRDGAWGLFDGNQTQWRCELDRSRLVCTSWGSEFTWPTWQDGALWVCYDGGGSGESDLLRFDGITGACVVTPTKRVRQIAAYRPGELLAVCGSGAWESNDLAQEVWVLDAATGAKRERLADMPSATAGALAYDARTEALYCIDGGQLLYLKENNWRPLQCYTSIQNTTLVRMTGILKDGQYIAGTQAGICVRETALREDPLMPLVVWGGVEAQLQDQFARDHLDIPLQAKNVYLHAEEVQRRILQGETSPDVFVVPFTEGVRFLIERGYAVELADSPVLTQAIDSLYLPIREMMQSEGRTYAYPTYCTANIWRVREDLLAKYGLGSTPTTWSELLGMYARWQDGIAAEHPEVHFLIDMETHAPWGKADYLQALVESQIIAQADQTAMISFDTEDFALLLDALGSMEVVDKAVSTGVEDATAGNLTPTSLFYANAYPLIDYAASPTTTMLPPRVSLQDAPCLPMELMVAVINPNSEQQPQAVTYMAYLAEHGHWHTRYLMRRDQVEPIRDEAMWEDYQALLAEQEELFARLSGAEAKDDGNMQGSIERIEAEMRSLEPLLWRLSAETVKQYQAIAQDISIPLHPFLQGSSQQDLRPWVRQLCERYVAGEMSARQWIDTMDSVLQRMFLEQ